MRWAPYVRRPDDTPMRDVCGEYDVKNAPIPVATLLLTLLRGPNAVIKLAAVVRGANGARNFALMSARLPVWGV